MFNLKIFNKVIYIMIDISNDNINTINNTMNKLDKTTLYFLSNKTYLNKLNNNLICDNRDDIKEDFIKYKKPIKNIINKLFEEYINIESNKSHKDIINTSNKYENAFYIFSKLCIQHIKSEELTKKNNLDLSNCSNFNNINLNNNIINIDDSNNYIYNDTSYDIINNDKILFNNFNSNNNNNNIKKFVDIKSNINKKKILPRRSE